ncbi:MAG: GrpB family protein [Polaromonas sp.]|uniref:GrpB family protein n=1 Tax=Polaromonas sp. TaxID=1869339 RepID=UPI002487DCC5|nr:GrpB family protein [Polaromonas sp.]MDI1240099.1 GrpB family protein [Polaromonas sp.]
MTDADSLHAAIHEDVSLQAYDSRWPDRFVAERDRLLALFPLVFVDIEHIGSTAVPGMVAKPIVDLLAGVESMAMARSLAEPLRDAAYTTSAEFNATLTDRQWFMRWADGRRTHHLHIVVHGGPVWTRHLQFRDALRASPVLAARYAALKAELAVRHPTDREAYTSAKTAFVSSLSDPT